MSVGGLRAKSAKVAPALRPPMAKVGRFMAIWPVLVTCTVKRLLESPTTTVPRFRVAGETPMEGGVSPVPVRVAETDATPRVLVATVNVAVVAPAALGVKTMETVQVAAGARAALQVVAVVVKAAEPGPLKENPGWASGAPPVLVTVRGLRGAGDAFLQAAKAERGLEERERGRLDGGALLERRSEP